MIHWIRLLRIPSLLVWMGGLYISYACVTWWQGKPPMEVGFSIASLIALLSVIAATYIDNDIHDVPADSINHPEGVLIGTKISASHARLASIGLASFGLCFLGYILWTLEMRSGLAALGVAVVLLFSYNRWLKSTVLLGDILLALLSVVCIAAPAIVGLEWKVEDWVSLIHHPWGQIFVSIGIVGFTMCLYRNIWRSLANLAGHRAAHRRTLAVVGGERIARNLASVLGLVLLVAAGCGVCVTLMGIMSIGGLYLASFVWIPLLISWIFGTWGRTPFEYAKAAMWSRHALATAMAYLLLYLYLNQ